MTARPTRRANVIALALLAAFCVLALMLPVISQNPAYHAYADRRSWLGIPFAANVGSNLAFIAVGTWGFFVLLSPRRVRLTHATWVSLACVAGGFALTAIGSAWYHAHPSDDSLAWDRLPMTIVLAGVIGAAIAVRVGDELAAIVLPALIVAGLASVLYWHASGNLTPYAVFQFGGMAALIALLLTTRAERDPFAWAWIIGWYCFAKLTELADHNVWDLTGGIVSGHTLKHLAAAAAGGAMFHSLRKS